MRYKHLKYIIVFAICLLAAISLCACKPHIDQDFIDLNTTTQPATTEPTESITEPPATEPTTQPTEESTPSFKPGGLVLPDETTPPTTEAPTEPSTAKPTEPEPTEPTTSSPSGGGHLNGIKISSGLKAALNSLGKTTYGSVTALQPNAGTDGSQTIIHIKNNGTTAQQYVYMYYESTDDYTTAIDGMSKDACNDKLRLILRGESEVLPVTNPETLGIVLFDGYLLWR